MEMGKKWNQLAEELKVDKKMLPVIDISAGSLKHLGPYLQKMGLRKAVIIADQNTTKVAGEEVQQTLDLEGVDSSIILLKENEQGQVNADEATLMQVMVETPQNVDVLLAVGAGTIHDITRFCGYKMGIPFISIPTAASVDGFTSKGAPLILRGVKKTIQTASPIAVFADITIIKNAPTELTAAGFGDMLGKYTSLLDWKISNLVGEEPYNHIAAELTEKALQTCVMHVDEIAVADDTGISVLMQALIESGLVMLLINSSRSASGGEHHLSHFWEMDLLRREERQILHGAKVGVATIIITRLYKQFANQFNSRNVAKEDLFIQKLCEQWSVIKGAIEQLPAPDELDALLKKAGGPGTPEELGIEDKIVEESLNEAYHLRDRCTGLLLINKQKQARISYRPEEMEIG
ncbi:sn-glycerol-1-phosphate dehydrogenase [Oceanobacillus manasiensis]|uniref:sn-glycerol-1-phosphate dehydrogenase n=1 Tax=Oceanobacillus manasiensis TaxID=586413 RepID=UPI000693E6A0|nr:sn-glycerol-1-phosphate dehydrogenase [Oceanobacillus manasiensis]